MSEPTQLGGEASLLTQLPPHQKWVAIALALVMLVGVVELVRRRKLREEYSALWITTAALLLVLALEPRLLNLFCRAIGAVSPIPALLFGGLVFLMLVTLLMSIRLSRLTARSKLLSQQVSLQRRELEELAVEVERLRLAQGRDRASGEELVPGKHARIAKDGAA
jgi:hypothetical protein